MDDIRTEDTRLGRDEMNFAVLPIARLGRNDRRDTIEYYGTFKDGPEQENMVWVVRGAAGLGLPTEFGDRVLVALLYLAAESKFAQRRMEFSVYSVIKTLGLQVSNRNYRLVEKALAQIAGILITSDKAWIEKKDNGEQTRISTARGFHVIDEYYLHYQEDESEGQKSFIVWGSRVWRNIQAGYLKQLNIDFYYSLNNPVARRLYRFLDKQMFYKPQRPYEIDVFALANKLGMAEYPFAAPLRRLLTRAANELVERGWLAKYEFFKSGQYSRVRFYRQQPAAPVQPTLLEVDVDPETATTNETNIVWKNVKWELRHSGDILAYTKLISIEDGIATVEAGKYGEWLESRMKRAILRALQGQDESVTEVVFC